MSERTTILIALGLVLGLTSCVRFFGSDLEKQLYWSLKWQKDRKEIMLELPQIHLDDFPTFDLAGRPLTILRMGGNDLTHFPDTIFSHTRLTELAFCGNAVGTIPDRFSGFTRLKELQLYSDSLERLPPSICWLDSLERLLISNNRLEVLPDSMGRMRCLSLIDAGDNHLKRITPSFMNSKSLKCLYLNNNPELDFNDLVGTLVHVRSLEELYLHDNQLSALPIGLERLTQLKRLNLQLNPLEQAVVDSLRRAMPNTNVIF